jgi:hypothetical protein
MYINIFHEEISVSTSIESENYITISRDDLITLFNLNTLSEIKEVNKEYPIKMLDADDYTSTIHDNFLYISYFDSTIFKVRLEKQFSNFYRCPVIFNY